MTRRLTCGTETGVGGEGARLMILLQFGLEREMSKKIFSSCISDYPALTCIQCKKNTASQHRPGTSDPLGAAFADEEAIAGTSHVPEILLCQYLDQSPIIILKKSYFLPGGAFLIGVASLHELHFTTCWSFLPEMSIIA